jgi:hypothetical protein
VQKYSTTRSNKHKFRNYFFKIRFYPKQSVINVRFFKLIYYKKTRPLSEITLIFLVPFEVKNVAICIPLIEVATEVLINPMGIRRKFCLNHRIFLKILLQCLES